MVLVVVVLWAGVGCLPLLYLHLVVSCILLIKAYSETPPVLPTGHPKASKLDILSMHCVSSKGAQRRHRRLGATPLFAGSALFTWERRQIGAGALFQNLKRRRRTFSGAVKPYK